MRRVSVKALCVGRRKCFFFFSLFSWVWVGGRRRRKHLFGEEKEARVRIIHVPCEVEVAFLSGGCGAGFATKQEEQNSTKLKAKNQICQGIFRRAATLFLIKTIVGISPSKVNISPAGPPAHERNDGDGRIFFFSRRTYIRTFKSPQIERCRCLRRSRPREGDSLQADIFFSRRKKLPWAKNLKIRSKLKQKQAGNYRTYNLQKFISDTASSSSIAVQ